MLIQQESPAPAPAAVSGSQKLLKLLRKRLRQLARVTLVLAICLAVAAAAIAIWWSTSLNGLPDIGDPFDVAAFRAFSIPDDQNAFAFLRRAHEKLTPIRWGEGPFPEAPKFSWSMANPASREWAGENREALELFLQGADQPDAAHPAGEPTAGMAVGPLELVAFLEGSRRQESGDTAGAWECYRAVLRMVGPQAPAGARALPPQAVAGWLVATLDARLRLGRVHSGEWPWPPDRVAYASGVGDRKAYRELVIMLATELHDGSGGRRSRRCGQAMDTRGVDGEVAGNRQRSATGAGA
jgi:hypothetical protein